MESTDWLSTYGGEGYEPYIDSLSTQEQQNL